MARRKKYDDEISKNSGGVGYSQAALAKLNAGTYGRDIGSKRQVQYRTSQEQTQQSRQLPVLEGLTRSNDWESNKVDTVGARQKYAEKINYKPIGRSLSNEDEELLYKTFDRNRLSSGGNAAIVRQLKNNIWHNTKDWEEKYGKTIEQIVEDYSKDYEKIAEKRNTEKGKNNKVLTTLTNTLRGGTVEPVLDTMSTLAGKVASNSPLTKAYRNAAEKYSKQKKQTVEGVTGNMSGVGKQAYELGTGLGERAIQYANPSALKYVLTAGKTAENTRQSLKERGIEGTNAEIQSGLAGLVDAGLDIVGLESVPALKGLVNSGNIGKEVLGRMLIGGGEQGLTNLINNASDRLLNGDKSLHNIAVQNYINQGMTAEEAENQATKDEAYNLAEATVSGGLLNNLVGFGGRMLGNVPSLFKRSDTTRADVPETESTQPDVIKAAQAQQAQAMDNINRLSEQIPDNSDRLSVEEMRALGLDNVPPEPPKTDISRRYETLKKSDLFTKSEANMKMLESAKEKGVFNKDVETRKVAQDEALQEYLNDKDAVIAKNLDKAWDSGKDVDTSMLILQDALDSGDNALTNLTLSKQVTKGKEAGRQLRAMRDYAYAGTKEGTITKAAEFLNDKADEVLSSRKTAEQFNAIAERILNGDLSDLDKRFNMDDINIQNIKDALDAGAGKADIAKMIAMYQSVGKTGISPEAIQQINDIYNQIEQGNFNPNSKARADLEADAFKVLANDIGGKRSWKEMWDSWRYLAMLGNPKTHLRNVLGNATHYMVTEAKDNIGAVIEGVIDKASRNGIERTKAVLSPTDRGLVNVAAKDADDVAYASLSDAKNKYDVKDEIGRARDSFNNKVLTKIDDLNSNALDLEDYSALKRKYSKSLARFLKANGADESIFNATDDASKALLDKGRAYAIDQAKQATFHEYSKMAQTLNQLSKNLSEGNAASKAGGMILEGLLPFKKTPINILKQGIKYSPVSIAKSVGTMVNAVKTGNKSAADAIEDLASGLTGTGIMAMGALLANQGLLTGGANENYDVDTAETEQGAQNYALKIGNNSYTLDWLAPMSLPLFVGAELMNKYSGDSDSEEGVFDRVISALSTIGEPITEMSMLQGIQNILNELSYSTENVLATFGTNATLGYASQAIPTLAGQFARVIDDTRRSTYTDKPAGFKRQFDKTLTKVENKIPFLSMTNEPYVDASGNTQQNEGLITSIFGNGFLPRLGDQMLSPGYYKQGNVSPVDEELNRLYEATGENVYKNVSSGKVNNEKLSKEKFTDYQKLYGSNTDTFYNGLVSSENYKNLDDAARVKALSEAKSISKMIADYEVGGKALKDSEQKVYDIYKKQGADGIIQYINDNQAAKSLDMSYETYVKKEAEQPGGAQAYVQEKQAAVNSGFVNKSGNADVKGYEKAMSQAGAQSQKFVNDLPMLQQTGLEKSAYYTYANAINVIPSLTPSEFAQTYNEINTNTSNAMTQKELLDYLNKYQFSDDPAEDERIANELWRAYGGWTNKAGVEKKIKLQNGQWKSYY